MPLVLLCVFLLSALPVSAADMYGVFMVVKGDIKVKNSKSESAAKVGSKILPGETVISGADSRAKIVMSDRNVINVSPATTLQLTKYENDAKSGAKNVEMNLLEGKVRNNVEQTYDGDKSKFLIKTPTAVAGVRGTQFFTSFNPATQMTSIVTLKGSVTLASVGAGGQIVGQPVVINKGETSSASGGQAPEAPKAMPKEELKKVDADSQASTKKDPPADAGAPKDTAAKDKSSGEKQREPAATGAPSATPTASSGSSGMIDKADVNPDIAKTIKPPAGPSAPPAPKQPVIPVPAVQNPIVRDVLRDNLGKTKVIVRPQQ